MPWAWLRDNPANDETKSPEKLPPDIRRRAFGACHLIGWDFLYPSSVEQLLWRIFSISCVVIPLLVLFLLIFEYTDFSDSLFGGCLSCLVFLLLVLYLLARAYLIVAIFRSLRSVPAGVYETVNCHFIFHIYSSYNLLHSFMLRCMYVHREF